MEKSRKKTKVSAKPAKKAPVRKRVVKSVRVVAARKSPKRRPTTTPLGGFLKRANGLWAFLTGGSAFLLAAGLWYLQKPLDTPAPYVMQGAPAQNVATAPVQPAAPAKADTPSAPTAPPAVQRTVHPMDVDFQAVAKMRIDERTLFWGNYLWSNPKAESMLGKLAAAAVIDDSAPIFPKKYDCTTFVETVAALARSKYPEEVVGNLLAIRYKDSKATFQSRNHFPEADWIPNNESAGILKDVTGQLATAQGLQAKVETKSVDRGRWLALQIKGGRVSRGLASVVQSDWSKPVEARVSYIPIENIDSVLKNIPSGTILNFVRNSDERHPVLITHQGFVVQEKGMTLLRHASSGGNVRTVVLRDYIQSQLKTQGSWRLIGINVNQLNGWSPRVF